MTNFVYRLSVATPTALIPQANQLAAYLGGSEADLQTFTNARYTDGTTDYCFIATVVTQGALARVAAPQELPDFVDAELLSQALQVLVLAQEEPWATAQPDKITALIGLDCDVALATLGLQLKTENDQL
jgi:hypothetical protein